jgi:hypothetical protein
MHEILTLNTRKYRNLGTYIRPFLSLIRKVRPKRLHKIDPRSNTALERLTQLLLAGPESPPDTHDSIENLMDDIPKKKVIIRKIIPAHFLCFI